MNKKSSAGRGIAAALLLIAGTAATGGVAITMLVADWRVERTRDGQSCDAVYDLLTPVGEALASAPTRNEVCLWLKNSSTAQCPAFRPEAGSGCRAIGLDLPPRAAGRFGPSVPPADRTTGLVAFSYREAEALLARSPSMVGGEPDKSLHLAQLTSEAKEQCLGFIAASGNDVFLLTAAHCAPADSQMSLDCSGSAVECKLEHAGVPSTEADIAWCKITSNGCLGKTQFSLCAQADAGCRPPRVRISGRADVGDTGSRVAAASAPSPSRWPSVGAAPCAPGSVELALDPYTVLPSIGPESTDMRPGDSGAPVFASTQGGRQAVAVHSRSDNGGYATVTPIYLCSQAIK